MGNDQLAMVSEWMVNGNINAFVKAHRVVNRFELVRFQFLLLLALFRSFRSHSSEMPFEG